jgi:polysaccharide transporter, PST family
MFFSIFVDYGFNLSATKEVSIFRDDQKKLTEIYSSVVVIKIILMLVSFVIFTILVFSIDKFSINKDLYFYTFLGVIGQGLFPIWYFQGLEKMKFITIINISTRLLFTVSIFILVKDESDYLLVPLLNSLGFIFSGFFSIYIVRRHFNQKFALSKVRLKFYFKSGYTIFISTVYTSFYRLLPINLLGIMHNMEIVAVYGIAEKLIRSLLSLYQPFVNSFFPFISKKFNISKKHALSINKKVLKFSLPFIFLMTTLLAYFSDVIMKLVGGGNLSESTVLLQLFSPLLIIIFIANIFGSQIMLHIGLEDKFKNTLKLASLVSLFIIPFSIYFYKEIGATLSVVFVELLVMLIFISHVYRKKQR